MTQISGPSPQISQFQTTLRGSLADRHLDQNELQSLKQALEQTPGLSEETRNGVLQFLEQAHRDSKGYFFGLFGKGISDQELGALKTLAGQSNNPILNGLVQDLEQVSTPSPYLRRPGSPSSFRELSRNFSQYQYAGFEPVS